METQTSYTQHRLRPGFVEFAFGEPDPALLPLELIRSAATAALHDYGPAALGYGAPLGPLPLRRAVAARIARDEGHAATPDDVLVSGGNSQGLDLTLTMLTRPDDVVLVESPTYSLALQMLRDRPLQVVPVPVDDRGLDIDLLRQTLTRLESEGRQASLLYTIPTFHNPAGVSLAPERRLALLALARERGLVVVEDDAYREIAYDAPAAPSLWALDPRGPVVRLGSFSKSLAPGLRVGWVNARADLLRRLAGAGLLESGGCVSQFSATVVSRILESEAYDRHLSTLRRAWGRRRDVLAAALHEHLPAGVEFTKPAGGFFIWLHLPDGVEARELQPIAERHKVSFAPGTRFCSEGGGSALRLAFALFDEEALAEGAARLGRALRALHMGG